jgi:hypothetical protein
MPCIAVEMRFSVRRCDLMMGAAGFVPRERRRISIPSAHVGVEVFAQGCLGVEVDGAELLLAENAEETFDLVEPTPWRL